MRGEVDGSRTLIHRLCVKYARCEPKITTMTPFYNIKLSRAPTVPHKMKGRIKAVSRCVIFSILQAVSAFIMWDTQTTKLTFSSVV